MFGHQNDKTEHQDHDNNNDQQIPDNSIQGALQADQPQDNVAAQDDSQPQNGAAEHGDDWGHPGTPIDSADAAQPATPISDVMVSPAGGFPQKPSFPQGPAPEPVQAPAPSQPAFQEVADTDATHELIDIKQHALTELSPLIDQLDMVPEDKFRIVMMMIQASDNQQMVKTAYEIAHQIEDEKARAQALLDIVNEINYFTQQPA